MGIFSSAMDEVTESP